MDSPAENTTEAIHIVSCELNERRSDIDFGDAWEFQFLAIRDLTSSSHRQRRGKHEAPSCRVI
jgi:hypothetical protein